MPRDMAGPFIDERKETLTDVVERLRREIKPAAGAQE